MAYAATTTASADWNSLVAERENLIHELHSSLDRQHNQKLDQHLAQIEERMLDLRAPDLDGVITKLQLIWSEQLHGEDHDSCRKLAILADLVRLSDA